MKCICIGDGTKSLSRLLPTERPREVVTFSTYKEAKDYIQSLSDDEMIIWHEGVILDPEQVERLRTSAITRLDAGVVSAYCREAPNYTVKDIYSPFRLKIVEGDGLQKTDIITPSLFVCKGRILKELDFEGLYIGLNLRKLGYQHYTNMDIEVSKENKNAKNNNVKGTSCKF